MTAKQQEKIAKQDQKKLSKKEQEEKKAREREARIIETQNKRLIDSALRSADGYYVTEQEIVKFKTMKEFDGKLHLVEEVKIMPVKKYIPPDSKDRTFLIQSRIPTYSEKPKEDEKNIWEVVFTGDALAEHYIDD